MSGVSTQKKSKPRSKPRPARGSGRHVLDLPALQLGGDSARSLAAKLADGLPEFHFKAKGEYAGTLFASIRAVSAQRALEILKKSLPDYAVIRSDAPIALRSGETLDVSVSFYPEKITVKDFERM